MSAQRHWPIIPNRHLASMHPIWRHVFLFFIYLTQPKASAGQPCLVCSPLLKKKLVLKCHRRTNCVHLRKMNLSSAKRRVQSHRVNKVQVCVGWARCNSPSALFKRTTYIQPCNDQKHSAHCRPGTSFSFFFFTPHWPQCEINGIMSFWICSLLCTQWMHHMGG